jgi:uncharacterized protein YwqG
MNDLFRIGDFIFEIDSVHSRVEFDHAGALAVTLAARTPDVKPAVKAGLLDDYEPTGDVKITFNALGVYHNNTLSGILHFKEEKQEQPYLTLHKTGFPYSLQYSGDVIFKEGRLLLQGRLKQSWDEKPEFPVMIDMQIDTSHLNWEQYCFTTIEEAETAPVEHVRKLALVNPTFNIFPKSLYRLKALRWLEVTARWPVEKLPLERLDDQLLNLTELEYLVIANTQLIRIPEYMNKLTRLKHCSFAGGQLSRVPGHMMDLPHLEYLNLNNNRISDIAVFDLPKLRFLHLANNQLKTLPENLLALPALEKADVSKNPFSFLPRAYSDFKGLKLDMEARQLLLDNTYKDADGQDAGQWDDSVYFSQYDADLIRPVDHLIRENDLSAHKIALRSLVKRAIGFNLSGEEDYKRVGGHRFGGMPDLPPDTDYPQYFDAYNKKYYKYEFIAQINCEALSLMQSYLPTTGTLFFFFETIHSLGSRDGYSPCKVLYVADNTTLQSGKRFSFPEEDFFELLNGRYKAHTANAVVKNSAPSFYAWHSNQHLFGGDAQALLKEKALLNELYDRFEEPVNALYPSDHEINAYGITQHESPEQQAALAQKGNPEDWIILLTVKSKGDFQWGDVGDLFFVIHKSDLANKDFRKVFVTLESS